jgi:hypothetical protein
MQFTFDFNRTPKSLVDPGRINNYIHNNSEENKKEGEMVFKLPEKKNRVERTNSELKFLADVNQALD